MRVTGWLRRNPLEAAWAAFAVANFVAMVAWPGWETIPFHFVWITLTFVYGVRVWSSRTMWAVLAVVILATGWHQADTLVSIVVVVLLVRAGVTLVRDSGRILLEAAPDDIAFAEGAFTIAGTDRRLSFSEVARAAYIPHNLPLDKIEPGLQDTAVYDPPNFAFSNGAHACEVEIDPDTGQIALIAYWAVDDIGTVINPMIVDGQVHGGVAQGAGQALLERCAYDAAGQLLSGSFMDYTLPRADDLPFLVTECDETQPCTHNPLGAKGCGEAGAIAAPAAIVSAALDALHDLGIRDLDMPLTPEQVWRRIRGANPISPA